MSYCCTLKKGLLNSLLPLSSPASLASALAVAWDAGVVWVWWAFWGLVRGGGV
jgi:hypothetical protein